jgi:hypothetical protein
MLKKIYASVQYRWLYYAALATLLRLLFGYFPELCEQFYSRGIFLLVRVGIDYTLGWLPFATIYWVVFFIAVWLILRGAQVIWIWSRYTWGQRISYGIWEIVVFLCRVWVSFLLMWGFNYARVPLETQIGLDLQPLGREQLIAEARWVQAQAINTRRQIPSADTFALNESHYLEFDIENMMRAYLADALNEWGFPTWGRVRGRFLQPNGILLRFSASGIYLPWTGEGHIDNALHPTRKPFTMAHELGHGYGFGDEAVCNFLGYVACLKSNHPAIRYSAYLMYWQYVMGELRGIDPDSYKAIRAEISKGMNNDLRAIYAVHDAYPPLMPVIQQAAYNAYLKSQGVKEGVLSYNRMIVLVSAWYKSEIFYDRGDGSK